MLYLFQADLIFEICQVMSFFVSNSDNEKIKEIIEIAHIVSFSRIN